MDNFQEPGEPQPAYINQSIIDNHHVCLTFVHILGVVEGEGDGEAAEEEDGGGDAAHHHALPGVAPALRVRGDQAWSELL